MFVSLKKSLKEMDQFVEMTEGFLPVSEAMEGKKAAHSFTDEDYSFGENDLNGCFEEMTSSATDLEDLGGPRAILFGVSSKEVDPYFRGRH